MICVCLLDLHFSNEDGGEWTEDDDFEVEVLANPG